MAIINMKQLLMVSAGGALGAATRYLAGLIPLVNSNNNFPINTLLINIFGSFILGLVVNYYPSTSNTYLFLGVGICGGFTTFSAFSKEAIALINEQQYFIALFYIVVSVLLGCIAFFIGFQLQKWTN
jgi:fluoride exporter